VAVDLTQPAAGATVRGPVTVAGSAEPEAALTVTASLKRPPTPTFTITDAFGDAVIPTVAPPTPPAPASVEADASGAFTTTLALPAGAWEVTVASEASEATSEVAVAAGDGLAATITIDGGQSYLELYEDGTRVPEVSGRNAQDGDTVQLAADDDLRIRVGNAAVVRLQVNGVNLGAMGGAGAVIEWNIARGGG
jgi:hypothetical protein